MANPLEKFSTDVMTFTQLLDEYIDDRRKEDRSEEETRRLAEVMYELNLRCSPRKAAV
jgi:hypothetical protein